MRHSTLSIETIGRFRFYSGLFAGILSSFSTYLLLYYFYQIFQLFHLEATIEISSKRSESAMLLVSATSVIIGTLTMYLQWFSNVRLNNFEERRAYRSARYLSLFSIWLILLCTTRLATAYFFSGGDYANVSFWEGPISFIPYSLIVIFVSLPFLPLMRITRVQRWLLYIYVVNITVLFTLSQFKSSFSYERLYQSKYRLNHEYISSNVERSETMYGLQFSEQEKEILLSTVRTEKWQVIENLKNKIGNNEPLKLKELIQWECISLILHKSSFVYDQGDLIAPRKVFPFIIKQIDNPENSEEQKIELSYLFTQFNVQRSHEDLISVFERLNRFSQRIELPTSEWFDQMSVRNEQVVPNLLSPKAAFWMRWNE